MVCFGEFLKTWSLRSNSVTRQVSFNRTKIGGKWQNSKIQMRHFEWFLNNVFIHIDLNFKIQLLRLYEIILQQKIGISKSVWQCDQTLEFIAVLVQLWGFFSKTPVAPLCVKPHVLIQSTSSSITKSSFWSNLVVFVS